MSIETRDPNYPKIIPDNNLRLPDAVTIVHGPQRLLARFILVGDRAAREAGLHLRIRHDFDALVLLNRYEVARGNWYPILDMYNPERVDLTPDNSFWISGENKDGEIVVTYGVRMFDWRGTNLAEQARVAFYGKDLGQPCVVTSQAASRISGIVTMGGVNWVRPDYRGHRLSALIPRIGKTYACGRWPVDWAFGYIARRHIGSVMPSVWGHAHVEDGFSFPGTPYDDIGIAYSNIAEVYEDIANFLLTGLSDTSSSQLVADFRTAGAPAAFEHIVTNTSSDGVFQGNNNRS
jgi:hypothetical protein